METVFGIDLGTSNILVAAVNDGLPRCVVGVGGTCPPIVTFGPNGPIVGSHAALRAQMHPETAIPRWKWLLGRAASSRAARRAATQTGFSLVPGAAGEACVMAAGAVRSPVDLAGFALRHAVESATRATGESPVDVVVGVPAVFDKTQRAALTLGAHRVDLAIDRYVRDTTAIALADIEPGVQGLVAIVDAGAAKVEVAIVNTSAQAIEVIARRSDTHTGVDDLDARLCAWLLADIQQSTSEILEDDDHVGEFLREEVASARRTVSATLNAPLVVRTPFLEGVDGRGLDATWEVPRAHLALLAAEAVERLSKLCAFALSDAGLGPEAIARVILTGGLGRIAEVRARVESIWQRACTHVPEGSVARGAALYGYALRGRIPLRLLHEEPVPEGPAVSPSTTAPLPVVQVTMPPSAAPMAYAPIPPAYSDGANAPQERTSARFAAPAPGDSSHPLQASTTSLPPRPAPSRSPSAMTIAVPRTGGFKATLTASDLLAMPLNRAATAADLNPPALPLVLLSYGGLKELTGTLTFKHGEDVAPVLLYHGTPTMGPSERARAHRVFAWRDGDYSFEPSTDIVPSTARKREPMATFVVAGLRPMLRSLADADVSLALANRVGQSPVVPSEKQPRVDRLGLTETEQRLVLHQFDGTRSLAEMFDGNPLGRQTLARLLLVLEVFGAVEWRQPKPPVGEDPRDVLSRRLERMRDQNHFDVIGVHWSVNPGEINVAWEKYKETYGPGSTYAKTAPNECRAILERGAVAYTVLSSDGARLKYRKDTFPEIDSDLLAPLLASRANALAMKGEMVEAKDMQRLLGEVSPRDVAALREQLQTPGIGGRPGPSKPPR